MRKKLSLILIIALAAILVITLVACNPKAQSVTPQDKLDPSDNTTDIEAQASKVIMDFSMPYANSVFNSVFISDFDLTKVKYSFIYLAADGSELSSKEVGFLAEDMIDAEDLPLLKQPGNHMIRVTAATDSGKEVKGQFQIRLKSDVVSVKTVELRFLLDADAVAYFGRPISEESNNYVVTEVDGGTTFASWADFVSAFRIHRPKKALSSASYTSGGTEKILSATNQGFPFVVAEDAQSCTFTLRWSDDVVKVTYDLNLPTGAVPVEGYDDPRNLFKGNGEYANVTAQRNVDVVIRPDTSKFNHFAGLYFSGWYLPKYTDDGQVQTDRGKVVLDRLWDFSKPVGNDPITLYAKWVEHSYAYTVYPMGGGFKTGITASKHTDGNTVITLDNYSSLGYKLLESTTRFTNGGELLRVSFEGFAYGDKFSDYVAEVTVDTNGTKVVLLFSEIYAASNRIFQKFDDILEPATIDDGMRFGGLFEDFSCETALSHDGDVTKVTGDRVGYIGWNAPASASAFNKYLVNALFDTSIKADGSVRIDATKDNSVNVIKIPATLNIDGSERPVTEIGERAISNLKALREVDVSEAVNLTTIGKEAFAFDTNLQTFRQPANTEETINNHITIVGKDAFANTAYEEKYTSISGLDFIIINTVLYKYTGTPTDGVVDISGDAYYDESDFADLAGVVPASAAEAANKQLAAATHIMDGAFENAKDIKEIHLHGNFQDIEEGAFAGLKQLEKLTVPAENALTYVSAQAFDECELFLSENSKNYNSEAGAIFIGNIYYYQVQRNRTEIYIRATYTMSDAEGEEDVPTYTISIIAPHAFYGCASLSTVVFEDEAKQIKAIGANAFQGTAYAQKDTYLVINGILAEFYGPAVRNGAVPANVAQIAENAFGSYASTLETLEIPNTVTNISAYAFMGASNLKSIILSSVAAGDKALANAPEIEANAFANKNGMMNENLKLYFSEPVIKLFEQLESAQKIDDPITSAWEELYRLNKANFVEEIISEVRIRAGRINAAYLDNSSGELNAAGAKTLFENFYNRSENKAKLSGAIEVYSNTGAAVRYNDFSLDKVSFKPLSAEASKNYNENGKHFILCYDYDKENYPDVFPDDESEEGYTVISFYKQVSGGPALDREYSYTLYSSNSGGQKMWIEGLSGNIKQKSNLPSFYTSTDINKLKVEFKYVDAAGGEPHTIPIDVTDIEGFVLNEEISARNVKVVVDFYGLGKYTFDYTYAAVRAKYEKIEQIESISIPLNARATDIVNRSALSLIGEDGSRTSFDITNQNFAYLASEISTDKLGQFTFHVTFNSVNSCVNSQAVSLDVVYSVVLEANPADFEYEISSNIPFEDGDKKYDGTANITAYNAQKANTVTAVIIPETYTVGGKTYQITGIGRMSSGSASMRGVFEGCRLLQTVYLSNGIKTIGTSTFKDCPLLKNVMSATASSIKGQASLLKTDFEALDLPMTKEKISGVDALVQAVQLRTINATYSSNADKKYYVLTIGSLYNYGDTDEETKLPIYYRVTQIADEIKLPERADKIPVYIYIPSTICNKLSLCDSNGTAINESDYNVVFYEDIDARFVVNEALNSALERIGNNAFMGCTSLAFNENSFTSTTNLQVISVGAFSGTGITSIDLSGTKIDEINSNLFESCAALESVKLPQSISQILPSAFRNCVMLSEINCEDFEGSLTVIAHNAFENCRSLKTFTLGASLLNEGSEIGENAFADCPVLIIHCNFASTLSNNANWHARWNSNGCPMIYSDKNGLDADGNAYVEEKGVRYMIASSAISSESKVATVIAQAYNLTSAVIVGEVTYAGQQYVVTSIAERAFEGNIRLQSVSLDYRITTIGNYAFNGCSALSEFNFVTDGEEGDNGLTVIGQGAFDGCDSLRVKPTRPDEVTKGDFRYRLNRSNNTATIIGLSGSNLTDTRLTIDADVTYAGITYNIVAIGSNAFFGNTTITEITLGKNVATIEASAFMNCSKLQNVHATSALKTIGDQAFSGCAQLVTFDFTDSNGLESVAENAFDSTQLADPPKPVSSPEP